MLGTACQYCYLSCQLENGYGMQHQLLHLMRHRDSTTWSLVTRACWLQYTATRFPLSECFYLPCLCCTLIKPIPPPYLSTCPTNLPQQTYYNISMNSNNVRPLNESKCPPSMPVPQVTSTNPPTNYPSLCHPPRKLQLLWTVTYTSVTWLVPMMQLGPDAQCMHILPLLSNNCYSVSEASLTMATLLYSTLAMTVQQGMTPTS